MLVLSFLLCMFLVSSYLSFSLFVFRLLISHLGFYTGAGFPTKCKLPFLNLQVLLHKQSQAACSHNGDYKMSWVTLDYGNLLQDLQGSLKSRPIKLRKINQKNFKGKRHTYAELLEAKRHTAEPVQTSLNNRKMPHLSKSKTEGNP